MPIKVENNHINVAVRDLLSSPAKTFKTLSSFPLPQRGMLGKQAQIKSQQQKQKLLLIHFINLTVFLFII